MKQTQCTRGDRGLDINVDPAGAAQQGSPPGVAGRGDPCGVNRRGVLPGVN